MPVYEYRCPECGLQFEELHRSYTDEQTFPCPECKSDAQKLVSASNFAFAHTVVGGPRPQNTGVHAIDYSADQVIGRDSEQRWKLIEKRNARKDEVIRDGRKAGVGIKTRDQLVRTKDNDYRPITEPERVAANKGREAHKQVLNTISSTPPAGKAG